MYLGHFFKTAMAWKAYTTLRAFWGPTFVDTSWQAWLSFVIPHFFLAIMFVVCGTSSRHVTEMKNCVTKMMSERIRCHYYARRETWHEKAVNLKHLCIQQCLTIFFLHWTTHNGSWKFALKNAANMHIETVMFARWGLVPVCLRPPFWKHEAISLRCL
jgi:hypothetical protein